MYATRHMFDLSSAPFLSTTTGKLPPLGARSSPVDARLKSSSAA